MCVCVCVYVYVYMYMYIFIYVYAYICIYVYICIYMCVCMYVCNRRIERDRWMRLICIDRGVGHSDGSRRACCRACSLHGTRHFGGPEYGLLGTPIRSFGRRRVHLRRRGQQRVPGGLRADRGRGGVPRRRRCRRQELGVAFRVDLPLHPAGLLVL